MKINCVELRKISLPYLSPFKSSGWTEHNNNSITIKITSGNFFGWGEAPVTSSLWYNTETVSTAWAVMQENLVPILFNNDINSPEDVNILFEDIKGNNVAKAGLEFAVWDLYGKMNNISLAGLIGGIYDKIPVGVSIGIQDSIENLLRAAKNYADEGYQRIKIKIKPGWDIEPVKAVRDILPDIPLQVDANSAYSLRDAEHLSKLDDFDLLLIEQPLGFDDIYEHAKLNKLIKTPICLDESITSVERAGLAIKLNACSIINIKPSRVGGITAAKKIHDIAYEAGIPVWCGGMLETGIGRAINVSLASLANFKLPGDISANSRYFERDIVTNPFALNADGTLDVPDLPGHGALVDEDYLDKITVEKLTINNL